MDKWGMGRIAGKILAEFLHPDLALELVRKHVSLESLRGQVSTYAKKIGVSNSKLSEFLQAMGVGPAPQEPKSGPCENSPDTMA